MVDYLSLKLEAVAMSSNFEKLVGNHDILSLKELNVLPIFSENVIKFFSDLSGRILKDKNSQNFPDLMTFGFHIRKSNINIIRKNYSDIEKIAYGRGLAYHIGPSNVPMNFAFSLFYSLLAGNPTIVRLPSLNFPQIIHLINLMNLTLDSTEHLSLRPYLSLVKFDKGTDLSAEISKLSEVRAVWGSDATVHEILSHSKRLKCKDLVFPARLSWSVISCKRILDHAEHLCDLANDFFNDTFSMDQNACSSPTQIFFLRDTHNVEKAKSLFWRAIKEKIISRKYEISSSVVMEREIASVRAVMTSENTLIRRDYLPHFHVVVKDITASEAMKHSVGGGLFFENEIDTFKCLKVYLSDQVQTVTTHKQDVLSLRIQINEACPGQVDRVVQFGRALDFGPIWDGYDLVREMSHLKI